MSTPENPRIALIAALEREIHPLTKSWTPRRQTYENRTFKFFERSQAVAVAAGIGAEAARRATQAVINFYSPELIYSVGFAGAATGALKIADILIPKKIINASDGSSTDTGEGEGTLLTFAHIAGAAQKSKLAASFNALAIDMEAAAVAQAAQARGIRFAAIKAISDASDFQLPPIEAFIDAAGQFRSRQFALFVMVRPWLWSSTLHLARNSAKASRALCSCLQQILDCHTSEPAPRIASAEATIRR